MQLVGELLRSTPRGWRRFWFAIFLAALASGASVALMGVSAWLISFAAQHPPVLYLQAAAVGVRAFGISRGVFRYLERLVGHDLALRMQTVLRLRTYDALSKTTLIGRRRGDLLTRVVNDVAAVQDFVVRVAVPIVSASVVVLGTAVMLGVFSAPVAGMLLVSALLAGVVVPVITGRASRNADLRIAPLRGELASEVGQAARVAPDLVAYGATTTTLDRISTVDRQLRQAETRSAWIGGLGAAGQLLAAALSVLFALVFGSQAVAAGTLDPRLLAVLVLTPLAMHEVLGTFTTAAQTNTRVGAALNRIGEILDAKPIGSGDATPGTDDIDGLELTEVSVGWPGSGVVQQDLSFNVRSKQWVALTGPSGIGKTTVATTIMGAIPPLDGTIRRNGLVGYLAQDAHIFATTVAENVRIGNKDATDEEVAAALQHAGLLMSPELTIAEGGTTLSGGERRRLALARVLVGGHDLVILDEPTEHLDQETARAIMADAKAAFGDTAVLAISHDPEVIALCDEVVPLS